MSHVVDNQLQPLRDDRVRVFRSVEQRGGRRPLP